MNRDISTLMMGMFSGTERDDFGRDRGARRSLLLDTVMEGRERASRSRLLQMPAEILADIVDLLADDKLALASLALVSSDCRQLARCCQFAEIQFDYSLRAQLLFVELAMEALERAGGTTRPFTIGACVRRVTFASHPGCVATCHRELYESIWGEAAGSYSQEQRDELRQQGNAQYIKLRSVSVLAISSAMPNLEVLTWQDRFPLDRDFFRDVSRSSARHIKLSRVYIDEPWPMKPPLTPAVWPLRSLDLDVGLALDPSTTTTTDPAGARAEELTNPMSSFFETLFRLCAPTLESLKWTHMDIWAGSTPRIISLGSNPISFPHLRLLQLGVVFLDSPGLSSLLSSPLRHLELPLKLAELGSCLATSEPLRDLESLVVSSLPIESESCAHVADFIKRHRHIQKLYVHEKQGVHGHKAHLDRYIIPALTNGGFSNLRCLSLAWGGGSMDDATEPHEVHIPETALATVGTIASLEQLSLCAGIAIGWRNQWLVDHAKLRAHLGGLSRLKMLALVRDTYPIRALGGGHVERYYSLRLVGAEERAEAEARTDLDTDGASQAIGTLDTDENGSESDEEGDPDVQIWERAHRNRMLTHAEAYAAALPALEWILCGQRPMGLRRDPESAAAPRTAVPLTRCRDRCYTFLERTFGLATDDGADLRNHGHAVVRQMVRGR